ncbi:MAG: Asp23/Gls24 family envelope stress response protein [Ruminococcaceae bacterium]|nr:Asp23/Gls24 family envelope stress response protein [Oscillospiraceae bacterium]
MEITSSNERGSVIISEEVLASIATNAAKDIDGVSSFSNRPVDVVSTLKNGSLKVMSPVRVLQNGDDITISIYLNLEPNQKIKSVAQDVQKNVKEAVQNMTGRLVSKVNVIVAGIDFEESGGSDEPLQNEE